MPSDPQVPFLQVKLESRTLSMDVASLEIEDDDRLIDRATIVVDDPNRPYTDLVHEGMKVRIDMGWGTKHAILFEGLVISLTGECRRDGRRLATINALDLSHKMNREQRTENHEGALSVILKKLVERSEHGGQIKVGEIRIDPDPVFSLPPLRQHNETDWRFIQRLAGLYHARAFVEFNDGCSRFYFLPVRMLLQSNAFGSLNYCPGFSQVIEFEIQRFAGRASAHQTISVHDPRSGALVQTPQLPPRTPDPPPVPDPENLRRLNSISPALGRRYQAAAEVAAGSAETAADQRPRRNARGAHYDPSLATAAHDPDPTEALGFIGRGAIVGNIDLRAKGKVSLHGFGTWADEGDWYLRRVTHVYTRAIDERRRNSSTYHTKFLVTR